jgi:hypothetical protein
MSLPSFQWADGIVNLQASDGAAICSIKVLKTGDAIGPAVVNRTGRGDTIAGSYRTGNLNGSGTYSGKMISNLMPIPTNIASFVGTMAYQLDDGQTITVSTIIENFSATRDQTGQNSPDVKFTFKHIGGYTLPSGATIATAPALSIKQTDEGLTKTSDTAYGLEKHATRRYDLPTVTDSDLGEFSAMSGLLSAGLAIPAGLKVNTISFVKTDRAGGAATVDFATTNPEDRREIPETFTISDPGGLKSVASVAKVNATPSVPAGFVERTLKTQAADGVGNAIKTVEAGLRSTIEDVTFPGTFVELDLQGLTTKGVQTLVFDNTKATTPESTTPAGTVPRDMKVVKETGDSTSHLSTVTYGFGVRTTIQDITFPGTFVETDLSDLDTKGQQTLIFTTGTTQPSMTAQTGLVETGYTITQETAASASNLSRIVYRLGEMTNKTKVETQSTKVYVDTNNLNSTAEIAKVDAIPLLSGAAFVDRGLDTQYLVMSGSTGRTTHTLNVRKGGTRSTADDVTYPKTVNYIDPWGLETKGTAAGLTSGTMIALASGTMGSLQPMASAGTLKFDGYEIVQESRFKYVTVAKLSPTNSEDRLLNPKRVNIVDPQKLKDRTNIPVRFDPTLGGPTDPGVPSGLKIHSTADDNINDHSSVRNYTYAQRDTKDDITFPGTFVEIDPSDLDSRGKQTLLLSAMSTPSATIPSGLVVTGSTVVRDTASATSNLARFIFQFGEMTPKTSAEAKATRKFVDVNQLDSTSDTAKLDATPALPSGFIDRGLETRYLIMSGGTGRAEHHLNIQRGGTRSTADDVTYPHTVNIIDPYGIGTTGTQATLTSGLMVPLTSGAVGSLQPLTSNTSMKLDNVKVYQDSRFKFVQVAQLKPTNSRDRLLYSHAYSKRSVFDAWIDVNASLWTGYTTADTPSSIASTQIAALQNGTNYYGTDVHKINDTQALIISTYYNPGTTVVGSTMHNPMYVPAKLIGGVVNVNVGLVRQRGSGQYWCSLRPKYTSQYLRLFSMIKMISNLSAVPDHSDLIWQTNASTFLGLAAGKFLYLGAQYRTITGLGNQNFAMVYQFMNDPNGVFDLEGWASELWSTTALTPGWTPISSFPQLSATIPTQGDFSVF